MQLIISTGPPQVKVPGVAGHSQTDAIAALKAAGFAYAVTTDFSDTVAAGTVIKQDPAPATLLTKFQTVTIDVSKGQQMVTIPAIPAGTPTGAATATLQQAQLTVNVVRASTFGSFLNEVISVSPVSGTKVPIHSVVTLYVV